MFRAMGVLVVILAGCAEDPAVQGDDPADDLVGGVEAPAPTLDEATGVLAVDLSLPPGTPLGDRGKAAELHCTILEPLDGDVVAADAPIHFEGEVAGAEGELQAVVWRSDVWGAMVVGTSFDYELPAADHLVTMSARDDAGRTCAASIVLHVE